MLVIFCVCESIQGKGWSGAVVMVVMGMMTVCESTKRREMLTFCVVIKMQMVPKLVGVW